MHPTGTARGAEAPGTSRPRVTLQVTERKVTRSFAFLRRCGTSITTELFYVIRDRLPLDATDAIAKIAILVEHGGAHYTDGCAKPLDGGSRNMSALKVCAL